MHYIELHGITHWHTIYPSQIVGDLAQVEFKVSGLILKEHNHLDIDILIWKTLL